MGDFSRREEIHTSDHDWHGGVSHGVFLTGRTCRSSCTHLHQNLLALILDTYHMNLLHSLEAARHICNIHHWGKLDKHSLGMAEKFVLPLHHIGLAILHTVHSATIRGTAGWVYIDDVHLRERKGESISTAHLWHRMCIILQDLEVVLGHLTELSIAFCVDCLLHPLREIPKVHSHTSCEVAEALTLNDLTLIACCLLRTALLGRHTSTHHKVGIVIPSGEFVLQASTRLNLIDSKGHVNQLKTTSSQKKRGCIVVEMLLYEIAKLGCPIHTFSDMIDLSSDRKGAEPQEV